MGWGEAADLIVKGMEGAISAKTVTYDFERLMDDATLSPVRPLEKHSSHICDDQQKGKNAQVSRNHCFSVRLFLAIPNPNRSSKRVQQR